MSTLLSCPGPNRRQFLRFGSVALASAGALGVRPHTVKAGAVESPTSNDPAVIFIWLPGGPPHQDTFDMKPDAPSEFRGEFKPIPTNVPGIQICEHMPKMSRVADKYTIIRSVAHTFADHGGGHKKFLTGRDPLQPAGFVNDYPMVGSMAAKLLEGKSRGLPNYVCGVDGGRQGIDVFSFGSAYLGQSTHPFMVVGDPSEPKFEVRNLAPLKGTENTLADRLSLLGRFDRAVADISGSAAGIDASRGRAVDLMTNDRASTAFDLWKEPPAVRDRYGDHRYGQRCLLARRLVESGVQWVTMVLENATPRGKDMIEDGTYNWDSHAVNCHIFKDTKHKLGFFDQAISALIEDLYARGLDKRVMVVVTGEFGRTPKLEYAKGRPGRDHWPSAQSIVVSGGGMKTGQVVGSTTSKAETPKDRPLTPNDLWATVFNHLAIDYKNTSFPDGTGRPMPMLTGGEPIAELL
ncbi:DUF1501 domain-containing protein [Fimbriiglobus ruber]|uniref:DUF1501 domain-containing protein n=1 Tax=Fimbriiglobus ruber TaxID=1908690 RepID=A0A225DIL5_9BACT|nr:DUF1501 domain-containing protein [Fimbriiglobus ruber]OWK36215.1 hypothetical protein FRUB_08778 [Fimbriiglobus ruber]